MLSYLWFATLKTATCSTELKVKLTSASGTTKSLKSLITFTAIRKSVFDGMSTVGAIKELINTGVTSLVNLKLSTFQLAVSLEQEPPQLIF